MAAYTQFGYGVYPSVTQNSETPDQQTNNTPTLSPTVSGGDCHVNTPVGSGSVDRRALSPDGMSQHSNNANVGGSKGDGTHTIVGPLSASDNGALATGNGSNGGGGNSSSCCENGRPIVTDPVSGQSVCSCQYDSARLTLSSYSRLPSASVGVYGTPYPSTEQNPYQSIGVDSSAFYTPLSNPYALKDSATNSDMNTAWTSAGLQPTTGYYSYDPMSAYGYGAASYDLAARRKNATRESTATLKAWLNEHKKNPYPTKGEKIMLAIITKMTLTQVSTWFANARRRLKKENKMTWEPKNRTDDDDDAIVSDDEKDKEDSDSIEKTNGLTGDNLCRQDLHKKDLDEDQKVNSEITSHRHSTDLRNTLGFPVGGIYQNTGATGGLIGSGGHDAHPFHSYHHQHPAYYQHQQDMLIASFQSGGNGNHNTMSVGNNRIESKNPVNQDCGAPIPPSKPKIWSLADTVACKTPPPLSTPYTMINQQQQHQHVSGIQHQQQPHQSQQHMISNFVGMPYSRTPITSYETFVSSTVAPTSPPIAHPLHAVSNTQYNSNFNNRNTNNNHPATTIIMNQSQLQQQVGTESTRQQSIPTTSNQRPIVGFSEVVQPDTPPQTPPNIKMVPNITTANLMLTNNITMAPMIATCRNINNNNTPSHRQAHLQEQQHQKCYNDNVVTTGASQFGVDSASDAVSTTKRFNDCSPRDDTSSGSSGSSCRSTGSPILHLPNDAYNPIFKIQQVSVPDFVPPV